MVYEKFKMTIKEELQKNYQEDVEVEICEMLKNNGRSYDGIRITMLMCGKVTHKNLIDSYSLF